MADIRKKQLAFNIIEFLCTSAQDGTVKEDDKESIDVAVQVISEAFGVDADSTDDQAAYTIKPASLLTLLDVFAKTKSKATPAAAAPSAPAPTADDSAKKAEEFKTKGNDLMSKRAYDDALKQYTAAIELSPKPVYYSNRAAAYTSIGKFEEAAEDAERALELDPSFVRAYSRLGHAKLQLQQYDRAIKAYEDGLALEPTNANMKAGLAAAKQEHKEQGVSAEGSSSARSAAAPSAGAGAGGMPDLASMANMFGGAGGGMPDLASMMQNPQMMAMAQQLMSNGGLDRLMQNPMLRNMAENMQNGGGMPDFNQLAQDPEMRNLASQFMGSGMGDQGQ